MTRAIQALLHNAGLKLLSLVLAIAAWGYLRFAPNPIISAKFDQQISVPVTVSGLPADEVAQYGERQALVTVVVPRNATAPLRPDQVHAVLALDGKGPGEYNVPLQVIAPKLELKSLSPASVTLTIERIEERAVPIAVKYLGSPRSNVVAAAIEVTPRTATVRAPTSDFAKLGDVVVGVPLPTAPVTFDAMVRPSALDRFGDQLSLNVAPNLVRVHARFVAAKKGA